MLVSIPFLTTLLLVLSGRARPTTVEFAGHSYDVEYADHVYLTAEGQRVIDLGYGQELLQLDFDNDGRLDLGVLADDRDGFRNTFAYLEMTLDDGQRTRESAKWKDGHWVWVDLARYPTLDGRTLGGLWLADYMRMHDDAML